MPSDEPPTKRKRTDGASIRTSSAVPTVSPDDAEHDEIIFGLLKERKRFEDSLLSVELLDEDGEVLWSCDNFCRVGHHERLTVDETPYPNPDEFWYPRSVWTVPVGEEDRTTSRKLKGNKLVLNQPDQVREVRVGMHRWKARLGEDVLLDSYDPSTQSMGMRLPIVMESHKANNEVDMMGSESLYLSGRCTVTNPQLLQYLADQPENYDSGWHIAHDKTLTSVTRGCQFPGLHDELRVGAVELVISGTVKGTLDHFGLFNPYLMRQL